MSNTSDLIKKYIETHPEIVNSNFEALLDITITLENIEKILEENMEEYPELEALFKEASDALIQAENELKTAILNKETIGQTLNERI